MNVPRLQSHVQEFILVMAAKFDSVAGGRSWYSWWMLDSAECVPRVLIFSENWGSKPLLDVLSVVSRMERN